MSSRRCELFAACLCCGAAPCAAQCDPGWELGGAWCFGLTSGAVPWIQGDGECAKLAAEVAAVSTAAENSAAALVVVNTRAWIALFCGTDPTNPGVGCTDSASKSGGYRFSTGASYDPNNSFWLSSQPDKSGQACVVYNTWTSSDDGFGDQPCTKAFRVLCRRAPSPTPLPTTAPTRLPSSAPSRDPTAHPSASPSTAPPTAAPTRLPSVPPTLSPSVPPTQLPSVRPSLAPSSPPTAPPSPQPSVPPSPAPTAPPTFAPSPLPSESPSRAPTPSPSESPTVVPSVRPSRAPTSAPSRLPSASPSVRPSGRPSRSPSTAPSRLPSPGPSARPSGDPSLSPSLAPSTSPTASPVAAPTHAPTWGPSAQPSAAPSGVPTGVPSAVPTSAPTVAPARKPTAAPSAAPSARPTAATPTLPPSGSPSWTPSTTHPSRHPTIGPMQLPTAGPTGGPFPTPPNGSGAPSTRPTAPPSGPPSWAPSATARPTSARSQPHPTREVLDDIAGPGTVQAAQGGAVLAPGSAGRLNIALTLGCQMDDVDLDEGVPIDVEFHPLRLPLGNHRNRYFLGAVVCNPSLVIAFLAMLVFCSYLQVWRGCESRVDGKGRVDLTEAMANLRSPGVVFIPFFYLLQGQSLAAANMTFFPARAPPAVCAFGLMWLAACAACPPALWAGLLRPDTFSNSVRSVDDPRLSAAARKEAMDAGVRVDKVLSGWQRVLYFYAFGPHIYVNTRSAAPRFVVERLGIVFESYRTGMQTFLVFEMAVQVLLSLLAAWKPPGAGAECNVRNALIFLVLASLAVLTVWRRPYASSLDNLIGSVNSIIVAAAVLLMGAAIAGAPTAMFAAAGVMLLMSALLLTAKAAWDMFLFLLDIRLGRRRKALLVHRRAPHVMNPFDAEELEEAGRRRQSGGSNISQDTMVLLTARWPDSQSDSGSDSRRSSGDRNLATQRAATVAQVAAPGSSPGQVRTSPTRRASIPAQGRSSAGEWHHRRRGQRTGPRERRGQTFASTTPRFVLTQTSSLRQQQQQGGAPLPQGASAEAHRPGSGRVSPTAITRAPPRGRVSPPRRPGGLPASPPEPRGLPSADLPALRDIMLDLGPTSTPRSGEEPPASRCRTAAQAGLQGRRASPSTLSTISSQQMAVHTAVSSQGGSTAESPNSLRTPTAAAPRNPPSLRPPAAPIRITGSVQPPTPGAAGRGRQPVRRSPQAQPPSQPQSLPRVHSAAQPNPQHRRGSQRGLPRVFSVSDDTAPRRGSRSMLPRAQTDQAPAPARRSFQQLQSPTP
eukprot:TRINITY_DN7047_c0_g1_i1.p1 TRINITY_DN7047_c0_g1~~TRINITY_DN7047_c0_g1_i1.p1  ORF type:complete len:1275 (+),score=141.23 TRINITY_DN7047_c0_g1_i1:79-3903(+)